MKILLATYWAIPHVGGVWHYMEQQKSKLESLGHEVDLLGYNEDNTAVYLLNKNIKIEKEKLLPLLEAKLNEDLYPAIHANALVKYTEFQRYVYELGAAYFGLDKYDVIHTQDVISTASIKRVLPESTALVATLHGSVAHEIRYQLKTIHETPNSYMARAYFDDLEHIGATSADQTIVANEWLKNILLNEFDVPNEQLKVLHYGFDTENFLKKMKEKTKSIKLPTNKKIILYTGRLVELKGVHLLISALHHLKDMRDDWVCWIVGDGDKQSELEAQTKELGLEDDIFFFGSREDVPYLVSVADIYVFPSLLENQPLSLVEAQIAGKPTIVSDAGGLPEMVQHGITGIISPAGDIRALCDNMNVLLSNENYRKKLGSNAKKWGMTHWSLSKGVKNVVDVYKTAISKRRKEIKNVSTETEN
ncbi:glycosyltransferase family 4 protein [Niallia sp. 03133]|uniref:glycosyltransferase family 4 protein n=1 Tax=Niallia sp. 03133 TaxID=3458060 RepID=UPI00404510A8